MTHQIKFSILPSKRLSLCVFCSPVCSPFCLLTKRIPTKPTEAFINSIAEATGLERTGPVNRAPKRFLRYLVPYWTEMLSSSRILSGLGFVARRLNAGWAKPANPFTACAPHWLADRPIDRYLSSQGNNLLAFTSATASGR